MAQETKNWLSRPEGKVGAVVGVVVLLLLAGLGVYAWGTMLPWIITMLENSITAAALCVALALIVTVVGVLIFDPRWRNLATYGYKAAMRVFTDRCIMAIDPINVMNIYVETLKENIAQMDESIEAFGGQIEKLRDRIAKNEGSRLHSFKLMQYAKNHGPEMQAQLYLQSRKAGRLRTSNLKLTDLLHDLERYMVTFKRMRAGSAILAEDIQSEVEVMATERETFLASSSILNKAKKVMEGGTDERELFDMAKEQTTEAYRLKMGEIEVFMDSKKDFLDGMDMDNGIFAEDGLNQFAEWEAKSKDLLIFKDPPKSGAGVGNVRVDPAIDAVAALETPKVRVDGGADAFADLFEDEPAKRAGK
ncbi:MAG: hypothetical protein ACHREM_00200 [Polyangiales bacterium]